MAVSASSLPRVLPTVALLAMTAVCGVTFVQVKDAVALYPIFLFLALRFAVSTATLGIPFGGRLRRLDRRGVASGLLLGVFLATGYALQTFGLSKASVTSTGFITGLFVPLTPVFAALIFRDRIGVSGWIGTGLAAAGLALLSGVEVGSLTASLLLFGGACAFALHIVFTSRFAPQYDVAALTLMQMVIAFVAFTVLGFAVETWETPRGWTIWGAVLVTGIFASALGFVVQTWAQSKTTATKAAVVITMEPVFAALFGYLLAGDRLEPAAWLGALGILAGMLVAEPALLDWRRRRPGRPRADMI
jgi:drug/metabolite transporter (DMT)-like permease